MRPRPRMQNKTSIRVSHHGHTGTTRHSPRNGFTAYFALSSVTTLFDTVACASYRRLDANDWGVRTTRLRRTLQHNSSSALPASTASRPALMTLRNAPLPGQDSDRYRSDLGPLASDISEFQKLVGRPSRRLPLRLDSILGNRLISRPRTNLLNRFNNSA